MYNSSHDVAICGHRKIEDEELGAIFSIAKSRSIGYRKTLKHLKSNAKNKNCMIFV